MSALVNVGDVLADKYRVEKVLGVGGMGMVVAAMHIELEERVALKFMLPAAMRSAQAVDRFLREAKSAVKLRSEHICRVLDVGKLANGAPYIVMEYMEGQDFAELISRRGPLPVIDAVDYMLQAIEGVAEAHANKIVHRDLKPGNLFVTTDSDGSPLVKVLDFGISKSSVAGAATKTGDIMGSPSYMAPEQMMSSKDVDVRADVWALGVILYQAVTGQLPFEAESLPVLCMAVMHDQPRSPTEIRRDLPPTFVDVVMRCLDKRIDKRMPDVAALATALVPFGGPDSASVATRIRKMLNRPPSVPAAAQLGYVPPTLISTADGSAVVAPTEASSIAAHPQASAQVQPNFGRISTLQASAGSLELAAPAARKRRRGPLLAGLGAAAIALVIGVAAIATRDTNERTADMPISPAASSLESVAIPPTQSTEPTSALSPGNPPVDAPSIDDAPAAAPVVMQPPSGAPATKTATRRIVRAGPNPTGAASKSNPKEKPSAVTKGSGSLPVGFEDVPGQTFERKSH